MADGDVVKTSLVLHLKDVGTQTSRMAFGAASTVTLAKAFYAAYGSAAITGASKIEELNCAAVAGSGDTKDNVDRKCIFTAKDSVTGEKIRFVVSAYDNITTQQGEKGERVTDASGALVCAAWQIANALPNPLVFLRGTPVQKA